MLEQTQPELDPHDILKAVLLYTLRYENTSGNKVDDYIEKMFSIGFDQEHIGVRATSPATGAMRAATFAHLRWDRGNTTQHTQLISAIRMYAGASVRLGDLFENKSFIKMARSTITRGLKVPCGPHHHSAAPIALD